MNDIIKYKIIPFLDFYDTFLYLRINNEINYYIFELIKNNKRWTKIFTYIFDNQIFHERFNEILSIKYMNLFINFSFLGGFKLFNVEKWGFKDLDFSLLSFYELEIMLKDVRIDRRILIKNIKYFVKFEKLKKNILQNEKLNYRILIKYYSNPQYLNILINSNNIYKRKIKFIDFYLNHIFNMIEHDKYCSIIKNFTLSESFIIKILNILNNIVVIEYIFQYQKISNNLINKYILPFYSNNIRSFVHIYIRSPSFSEDFIINFIDYIDWNNDCDSICKNKLSQSFIEKYIINVFKYKSDSLYYQYNLLRNSILSHEFLIKYYSHYNKFDFVNLILSNKDFPSEYIINLINIIEYFKYPKEEYIKKIIFSKIKLPEEFIKKSLIYLDCYNRDYEELLYYQSLSVDFIINYIDINKITSLKFLRNNNMKLKDFNIFKNIFNNNQYLLHNNLLK